MGVFETESIIEILMFRLIVNEFDMLFIQRIIEDRRYFPCRRRRRASLSAPKLRDRRIARNLLQTSGQTIKYYSVYKAAMS